LGDKIREVRVRGYYRGTTYYIEVVAPEILIAEIRSLVKHGWSAYRRGEFLVLAQAEFVSGRVGVNWETDGTGVARLRVPFRRGTGPVFSRTKVPKGSADVLLLKRCIVIKLPTITAERVTHREAGLTEIEHALDKLEAHVRKPEPAPTKISAEVLPDKPGLVLDEDGNVIPDEVHAPHEKASAVQRRIEDSIDVQIAQKRLDEIKAKPDSLLRGTALDKKLKQWQYVHNEKASAAQRRIDQLTIEVAELQAKLAEATQLVDVDDFKRVYAAYERGDHMSDEDLSYIAVALPEITAYMKALGPRWMLAWRPMQTVTDRILSMQAARKGA
jgi:hypothetical protein